MLYVLFNKGLPVRVTTESPYTGTPKLKEFPGLVYDEAKSSWDYKSFAKVEGIAMRLTAMTGKTYLPCDASASTSPRYSVIEAPAVGDPISYGFNGDYYPCGTIVKITKGWRITSSTGKVFNRRKNSCGWRMVGGTWGMVAGHVDERNPHV